MQLLFDLDGTLFQTKPVLLRTAQLLFRALGTSAPDDGTILKSAGKSTPDFLRDLLPSDAEFTRALALYPKTLNTAIADCGELFPGTREMLSALHDEGHPLVICSKSSVEYIDLVLKRTGIAGLFAARYSSGEYPSKAALFCEIAAPREAVVIGDTFPDIAAALENRIASIAAMYGYGNPQKLLGATVTADSPTDIYACVRRLCEYAERAKRLSPPEQLPETEKPHEFLRYLEHVGFYAEN